MESTFDRFVFLWSGGGQGEGSKIDLCITAEEIATGKETSESIGKGAYFEGGIGKDHSY